MKRPLISVCIPTFNGEAYIRPCLASVLSQTFEDFEVIISDDGSLDGTLDIVHDYARQDRRVKVFQNHRAIKNVNRCLGLANGQWIKFVFQDDLLRPDCLQKMVSSIDPAIPIICSLRDIVFENGVSDQLKAFYQQKLLTMDQLFPDIPALTAIDPEELALLAWDHLGKNFIGEASNVMLQRTVCAGFGYWNGDLPVLGDLEFWMRIGTNTGIVYVPQKLSSFRVHTDSKSGNMREDMSFRDGRCEIMLLLCQFAFHPQFAAFRKTIEQLRGESELTDLFSWWVRDVYKAASENDVAQRQSWLAECVRKYPVISQFSRRINVHSALLGKARALF